MNIDELSTWFVNEVLPLEALIESYLRRNWRDASEIADLRQEVYVRVFERCQQSKPDSTTAFVMTTARNLLIDRARRAKIVSIEIFADVDALELLEGEISYDRQISARSEIRRLQLALDTLTPRSRQIVELRKIEGLSQREVAARLALTEDTVERQLSNGIRALNEAMSRQMPLHDVSKQPVVDTIKKHTQ